VAPAARSSAAGQVNCSHAISFLELSEACHVFFGNRGGRDTEVCEGGGTKGGVNVREGEGGRERGGAQTCGRMGGMTD
jgi:hypothetical protein